MAHRDIPAEDNINAARHDFSHKRGPLVNEEADGDVEISRGLFFSVAVCIRAHFKFPVTEHRRCGNSTEIWWQKNRTYHNGMGGTRTIVETLRQFFDIQSTGSSIAIPLLRFAAELRVFLERLLWLYTRTRRLTRDNRFYDYALPRCESTDACAASWLDAHWWALLNRITSQSFHINGIIGESSNLY